MMSMLLLLAAHTVAGQAPSQVARDDDSSSVSALVYVEKRAKEERKLCSRKDQMIYEIGHFVDVYDPVLKLDELSRLPSVRKQKDARAWLKKNLRVESVQDTGVVRVSFEGAFPAEQVAIVNAVAKTYAQQATDRNRLHTENRIADLRKDCDENRGDIRREEARLVVMNAMKPANEGEAISIERERNLRGKWIAMRKATIRKLESIIRELQEHLRKPFAIVLESAELPPDSK